MTGMRFVWRCVGVGLWVVVAFWTFSTVGETGPYDCGSSFNPDRTAAADEDADPDLVDEDFDDQAFLADCDVSLETERFRITLVALTGTAALAMGGASQSRDDPDGDGS